MCLQVAAAWERLRGARSPVRADAAAAVGALRPLLDSLLDSFDALEGDDGQAREQAAWYLGLPAGQPGSGACERQIADAIISAVCAYGRLDEHAVRTRHAALFDPPGFFEDIEDELNIGLA